MTPIRLQQMLHDDLVTIQKLTIMVTPCPSTSDFVDQVSQIRKDLFNAQDKILSLMDHVDQRLFAVNPKD
jgi:hypothetical protein